MTARLIDGKALAATIREKTGISAAEFTDAHGVVPTLAAVLVGDDPASHVYVRNKQQACKNCGLKSVLHQLPDSTREHDLLALVKSLNSDPHVHGILIQLPLPPAIRPEIVLDAIDPRKDVDAFHPENVGLLMQGRPRFLPCTPHGVQVMLHESQINTAGQHVVVVGRSDIVGKPLAIMLAQKGMGADATVTICHSKSQLLSEITRSADILIAAIGRPKMITADMVRPGAVVIDVGINRIESGLVGDVDFEAVREVASAITPVPGGVGPMTIAMLMKNTLHAAKIQLAQGAS